MPDQADELRRLVAKVTVTLACVGTDVFWRGQRCVLMDFSEETAIISTHHGRMRVPARELSVAPAPADHAKLWATLESDLERWVRVGGFDKPNLSTEALAEFWEMMQRRQERAP